MGVDPVTWNDLPENLKGRELYPGPAQSLMYEYKFAGDQTNT